MTFTAEEKYVLERLVNYYGPEVNMDRLNPNDNYEMYAQSTLRVSAEWYATHKAQQATDWAAKERARQEEMQAKLAARSAEVIEATVTGIMAGLMPKLGRAGMSVAFDVDESEVYFTASTHDLDAVIMMSYDKGEQTVTTRIHGGNEIPTEDVSLLSGNRAPREQLKGLQAVHAYVDTLVAAREAGEGQS